MRWPFGPPPQKLKKRKKQSKKGKKGRKQKTQEYPKNQSVISHFFLFLVGVQNFPFCQLGQKSAQPKNTLKIGVSATHLLENSFASRNGHFWTKKPNPEIPVIIFFAFLFSFNNKKTPKLAETPIL